MIRTPPFSFWPLHVKLFTEEASDIWQSTIARNTATSSLSPPSYFPPGFSWSIELEGVDGRSGHPKGSGRTAPLDVKDEHFISAILAKNTAVIASGNTTCAVCKEDVGDYAMASIHPLPHLIHTDATALYSGHFDNNPLPSRRLLSCVPPSLPLQAILGLTFPCPEFSRYTQRRQLSILLQIYAVGRHQVEPNEGEEEDDQEGKLLGDPNSDPEKDLFTSDSEIATDATPKAKGKGRCVEADLMSSSSPTKGKGKSKGSGSSSGESFDLDVSSSSDSEGLGFAAKTPRRGRRPNAPKTQSKSKKDKSPGPSTLTSEETPVKRGRPPKVPVVTDDIPPARKPRGRPPKVPVVPDNSPPAAKRPRGRPPQYPDPAQAAPKTPRGRGRPPKSPTSRRGLSTVAGSSTLLNLDLDSDDDLEEYDPSIISTLGSSVRITPKKTSNAWTAGDDVWEILSDEDHVGEGSKHVDEIALSLGALNLADSAHYVDSEDDIFLP
ncbi:hypothetical protein MD484_g4080, partial [Candolleomyces efflorescens]